MPDRTAMSPSDAQLLERLADALAPPYRQPTEAGLAALWAAVDARTTWPAGTRTRGLKERWRSWTWRSRRGLAALGLIAGVCVGGTGAAFAGGASLPEPIRAVAHHLGLPVGSPAPLSARHAGSSLRRDPASSATDRTRTVAGPRASGTQGARPGYLDSSNQQKAGSAPLQHITGLPNPVSAPSLPLTTYTYTRQGQRQPSTPATNALCHSDCRSGQGQPPGSGYGPSTRTAYSGYPTWYPANSLPSPGPGGKTTQTTDSG
jgi:hypothetical protein